MKEKTKDPELPSAHGLAYWEAAGSYVVKHESWVMPLSPCNSPVGSVVMTLWVLLLVPVHTFDPKAHVSILECPGHLS